MYCGSDVASLFGEWGTGQAGDVSVSLLKPGLFGSDDYMALTMGSHVQKCKELYGWSENRQTASLAIAGQRLGGEQYWALKFRNSTLEDEDLAGNPTCVTPGKAVFASSLIHRATWDTRESTAIPGPGMALRITNELCVPILPSSSGVNQVVGMTGNNQYRYHKCQVEGKSVVALGSGLTLQTDLNAGFLRSLAGDDSNMAIFAPDRFYLGGPHPIRGFVASAFGRKAAQDGNISDALSGGGTAFLTGSALLRYPLQFGVLGNLNAHVQGFVNAGSLQTGCIPKPSTAWKNLVGDLQPAVGVGMVVPMSGQGRIEFNLSRPMGATPKDMVQPFQLNMSVDWL